MHHDLGTIQRGWAVYDANDEQVGDVADVGSGYVLVQAGRLPAGDLYIPTTAITETDEARGRVYLGVPGSEVDTMGWEQPPAGDAVGAMGSRAAGAGRTDFDYGVTATDRAGTAGGNLSGEVMDEADARVIDADDTRDTLRV